MKTNEKKLSMQEIVDIITESFDGKVEQQMIQKNSTQLLGLVVGEGDVKPVIYPEVLVAEGYTFTSLREFVLNIKDKANRPIDGKTVSDLLKDKKFLKENCYCAVRPTTEMDVIKKSVADEIEMFIKLDLSSVVKAEDNMASVTLKEDHLKLSGLSIGELWEAAEKNTIENTTINDLMVILSQQMGIQMGIELPTEEGAPTMIVVSNRKKYYGASGIFFKEIREKVREMIGEEFVVLPSSIHEVVCNPVVGSDEEDLSAIISEVNRTQVPPEEILGWKPLYFKEDDSEGVA